MCEARIRAIADAEFERCCAEGRTLTLDDAVIIALAPDENASAARAP